jgi:hypothetical protein
MRTFLLSIALMLTAVTASAETYTAEETRARIRASRGLHDLRDQAQSIGIFVKSDDTPEDLRAAISREEKRQAVISDITCARIKVGQTYANTSYSYMLSYGEQAFEVPFRTSPMRIEFDDANASTSIMLFHDGDFFEFARLPAIKPNELIELLSNCPLGNR